MDFYKIPIGFGMALAMNPDALSAYSAMTKEQKCTVLNQARGARNEQDMQRIVNSITK